MSERIEAEAREAREVIDHLGDLIAHFSGQSSRWQNTALAALEENARIRTELAATRAEIERQRKYIAGRDYEC